MKRYLVFAGYNYYPGGGWNDFVVGFDTLNDAQMVAGTLNDDWVHIVDAQTREVTHVK